MPALPSQPDLPAGRPPLGQVLVVIPTYNEAENIEGIVGRVRVAAPDAEILVADDNSPDGTASVTAVHTDGSVTQLGQEVPSDNPPP